MFEGSIRNKKDEIINGVLKCVKIDSVCTKGEEDRPFGPGPFQALHYALELAETMGFRPVWAAA